MIGARNEGDPHLNDIWLYTRNSNKDHVRRAPGITVKPFLLSNISSLDYRVPLKARKYIVTDDVSRGLGIAPEYIEVLGRRRIIFDDEGEDFGYIVGETKFQATRHLDSPNPQILYLFGICPSNTVIFFGQFRPLDIPLRALTQDEVHGIPGLQPTNQEDLKCTAIQLVEDGTEDFQTSVVIGEAMARVEKLGGGLFHPKSTVS